MTRGESATVLYPNMSARLSNRVYLSKIIAHLDACKDVCDNFGIDTILLPHSSSTEDGNGDGDGGDGSCFGFTVKSYRNLSSGGAGTMSQDLLGGGNMKFAPDPFWDDDEEWDFGNIDDDDDDAEAAAATSSSTTTRSSSTTAMTPPHLLLPNTDEQIISITESWVQRMMSDLALCPFTQSYATSGIPPGPVHYAVDRRVSTPEDAYASYWDEVSRLLKSSEREISTTLHILPTFCTTDGNGGNVEMFEQWADTLTGALNDGISNLDDLCDNVQLIFFHPRWTFRDGGRDRLGTSGMAGNYARRSPWPMVNILRTNQVRVAQRGIPTGLVYQQNERTLSAIGPERLERMLRLRDWEDVEGMKVDRRDMEALRVANDLQIEGVVKDEDLGFAYDSTPAANRVDRSQIEKGDMVKVILQALGIRLGTDMEGNALPEGGKLLTGSQTSAVLMATDFLLDELKRIETEYPEDARAPSPPPTRGGYAAAYGFDVDEYDNNDDVGALNFGTGKELEDAETSALWGMGGIKMKADE